MITRVSKLTSMNVSALRTAELGVEIGATYADFAGTPSQALAAVTEAMTKPGRLRRSLFAVQRKLGAAAPRYDAELHQAPKLALTPHVSVTR